MGNVVVEDAALLAESRHITARYRNIVVTKDLTGEVSASTNYDKSVIHYEYVNDDSSLADGVAFYYPTGGVNWRVYARGMNAPVAGVGIADATEIYVGDTDGADTGTLTGETTAHYWNILARRDKDNNDHNWWGGDYAMLLSESGPAAKAVGISLALANPYVNQARNYGHPYVGTVGISVMSLPGIGLNANKYGMSLTGLETYPWDCGICIGGFNGIRGTTSPDSPDARPAFLVGLSVGGNYSPWARSDGGLGLSSFWESMLKTGIEVERHTHYGIVVKNAHPEADADIRALWVQSDAGYTLFDSAVTMTASHYLQNTSAGTNSKVWRVFANLAKFQIQVANDDFTTPVSAYDITRSSASVTTHEFLLGGNVGVRFAAAAGVGSINLPGRTSLNFADDTAAAAGGVPVGYFYHNAGALRIRLT